ncbi:MAG: aminoglycoside phosphotransferase family protein [Armatimonas sp.]
MSSEESELPLPSGSRGNKPSGTPTAEVSLTEVQIRALLWHSHPDLAELPLTFVDSGWDNAMWRLGETLALRLPRRETAVALIQHEQRWLPRLAPELPLPTPAPVRVGEPTEAYPWPWSVVLWMPGRSADLCLPNAEQGPVLAAFLKALHQPAPPDAPHNPVRGAPLIERQAVIEERLARVEKSAPECLTPRIYALWEQALAAPSEDNPTWLHGDLHSRNVLVGNAGELTAVIDWGDMTAGDRATDLMALWTLLPDKSARIAAMQAYGPVPEALWQRARGWAVSFGLMLLASGLVDDPRLAAAGRATLERLVEGP